MKLHMFRENIGRCKLGETWKPFPVVMEQWTSVSQAADTVATQSCLLQKVYLDLEFNYVSPN